MDAATECQATSDLNDLNCFVIGGCPQILFYWKRISNILSATLADHSLVEDWNTSDTNI